MAGSYADPGSWRMAWDVDGSFGFVVTVPGIITQVSTGAAAALNSQNNAVNQISGPWNGVASNGVAYIGVVFPEQRDIDAYFMVGDAPGGSWTVQTSVNTTNGQDGTWVTQGTVGSTQPVANWRTGLTANTILAVKGFRFYSTNLTNSSTDVQQKIIHLYGEPAPGENPDRLAFWDAATDQKMPPAVLDWGNVPRSSSDDRVVRVKNMSATKTAGDIRVSFSSLTDAGNPSVPASHFVSYDGTTFLSQVNIGSLAPGAISGPVTLRRVTPSNAQLGLFSPRVSAVPDTFV